jgi:hypothetical protein
LKELPPLRLPAQTSTKESGQRGKTVLPQIEKSVALGKIKAWE